MPLPRRPLGPVLVLLAALTLAACDSAEERAQGHYEAARALVAEGEIDRAILEFRNALRLDENLAAARLDLARIQRDRGETERAYGHFRLLADQKSDDPAIQREYAELAVRLADFETARAAADRAHALAPADPAIQGLKASLDYRAAMGAASGAEAREAALALARAAVAAAPDAVPAQMVLIAERMRAADPAGALALADAALAAAPQDEGLHLARLAALEALGDGDGIGAQLAAMAGLFPDNDGVREALVRWHLSRGDLAAAEAELRAMAARDPAAVEPALTVARFLYETQGPEAARAELDRLAAAAADPAALPARPGPARLRRGRRAPRRSRRCAGRSSTPSPRTPSATPRPTSPACSARPATPPGATRCSRPCSPGTRAMSRRSSCAPGPMWRPTGRRARSRTCAPPPPPRRATRRS